MGVSLTQASSWTEIFFKKGFPENQDGGIGRHTAPPRTTRTDRKSNSKELQQVDKKETYIQTGRRGGDGQPGGEDLRGCGGTETGGVWDERDRQSDH